MNGILYKNGDLMAERVDKICRFVSNQTSHSHYFVDELFICYQPVTSASTTVDLSLPADGDMSTLIRQFDWAATPIGTADQWPVSLRTLVRMILTSRFPSLIFWGPELTTFYNDAFRPSLGNDGKHPASLGQPGHLSWSESWPVIGPMIHGIMDGSEAVWFEDQKLPIYREGRMDYAYWTYCFSPLTDDKGAINGVLVTCTETTKTVESLERLEASQHFADSLFYHSPIANAVLMGPDMIVRMANQPMLSMWGRDESILGKPFLSVLPELTGTNQMERLQRVLTTGESFRQIEEQFDLLRYGQPYTGYYNYVYDALRDKNKIITGVVCVAYEVTDQVLARRAVEDSEARFRSLIEEAPVATALYVGEKMLVQVANQTMLTYWGKNASVLGKPLDEALPELVGQPFLTILAEVFRTGILYENQAAPAELEVDGVLTTSYFDYTYKPLRNAAGEVYAIMNTAIDVTQSVKAGQQVQLAKASLQQAVDLAQLGIWQIDIATQEADFSERVVNWVGADEPLTLAEAIAAIEPAYLPGFVDAYQQAQQSGSDGRLDVEYQLKNVNTGQTRLIHSIGQTRFSSQGVPVVLSGFSRDVTHERAVQLALQQQVEERTEELAATNEELAASNEELEEANQLLIRSNDNLQQFAYVASHDLQEPLRKIQQFGNLLQLRQTNRGLDTESVGYIERMQLAATRMSTLIRDLLTYSRIETHRDTALPVSLNEVVTDVQMNLELQLSETHARLEVDALPVIIGDFSQLSQLFQNLIGNALKFRRDDTVPMVRINTQLVTLDQLPVDARPARQVSAYHRIDVVDNGIGFDGKYVDRIFQVFQRLHSKNEYAGTGIGLAICQKVVANHGGSITAQSQPGQGATFSVYLPA
jgi:signal transduction histidine kinase